LARISEVPFEGFRWGVWPRRSWRCVGAASGAFLARLSSLLCYGHDSGVPV
jgi:hypothetical protein